MKVKLNNLKKEVQKIGKPQWQDMLTYLAELHGKSTHPPRYPFRLPWEGIGPGYCYGPAFGHWDIINQIVDTISYEPVHAENQIINHLSLQQSNGMIPGLINMQEEQGRWNKGMVSPPLWVMAVDEYCEIVNNNELIEQCYDRLVKQINWFEKNRKAEGNGFYYRDILDHAWESGIDDGVRYDNTEKGLFACIDATSHVYALYEHAARWAFLLGKEKGGYEEKAKGLCSFIQDKLYDEQTGFFYDIWVERDATQSLKSFEGIWPVIVGAATTEQANRVIDESILNPDCFFSEHPLPAVSLDNPLFELRMWRGATWNSITYWVARGCNRYERHDAACAILERALDATAAQFKQTGTIWEFYHPFGDSPLELQRKPYTEVNAPCRDYVGHNPLIAMTRMWESKRGK